MIHDRRLEELNEDRIAERLFNYAKENENQELHRFYLYDKKKDENSLLPFLYAYTNDKEISDTFKMTRNPDLFIYKHSREPIEIISDIEHNNPGIRLRRTCLKSRSKENPGETVNIPIVLTCDEELRVVSVSDDLFHIINAQQCMEDMTVLSTGLNKALKSLGYFDIYRYLCQMQYIDTDLGYFYEGIGRYCGLEPGMLPNIIPDEFSLFMLMYGNTLRR